MKSKSKELLPWAALYFCFGFDYLPESSASPAGVLLSLWSFARFRPNQILKTGIGLCFLPSEFGLWFFHAILLQILLVLLVKRRIQLDRTAQLLALWLGWCFLSYVLSQRIDTNPLSFWMFMFTFGSSVLALVVAANLEFQARDYASIAGFFLGCLSLQGVIVGTTALRMLVQTGSIVVMDWGFGSAYIALPFLLVAGIFYLSAPMMERLLLRGNRSDDMGLTFGNGSVLVLLFTTLYFTGSNTVIFAMIIALGIGFGVAVVYVSLHRRLRMWWVITLGIGLAVGSVWGSWWAIHTLYGSDYMSTYVSGLRGSSLLENPGGQPLNHKYRFFERAIRDIPNRYDTWWTGTGPGTVGTRASNLRAYDTMYKDEQQKKLISRFLPPYTSPPGTHFFSDLFQEEFAKTSRWRSTTLSQPFSSLISSFVETGIIGFLLLWTFFFHVMYLSLHMVSIHPDRICRHIGLMVYFLTICLMVTAVFDTYLERPTMMTAYWIFVGLAVNARRHTSVATRGRLQNGAA